MSQTYGQPQSVAGGRTALSNHRTSHSFEPSHIDTIRQHMNKLENLLNRVKDPLELYVEPQLSLLSHQRLPLASFVSNTLLNADEAVALNFRAEHETDMTTCTSYLPAIGRLLIVVTFFEDSFRIITQWNDQVLYLDKHRGSTTPWADLRCLQ